MSAIANQARATPGAPERVTAAGGAGGRDAKERSESLVDALLDVLDQAGQSVLHDPPPGAEPSTDEMGGLHWQPEEPRAPADHEIEGSDVQKSDAPPSAPEVVPPATSRLPPSRPAKMPKDRVIDCNCSEM